MEREKPRTRRGRCILCRVAVHQRPASALWGSTPSDAGHLREGLGLRPLAPPDAVVGAALTSPPMRHQRVAGIVLALLLLPVCTSAASPGQPTVEQLLAQLGDDDSALAAAQQLADRGEGAVPALVRALRHQQPGVQRAAALWLRHNGEIARRTGSHRLWWVLPAAFWREGFALALAVVGCFLALGFSRRRGLLGAPLATAAGACGPTALCVGAISGFQQQPLDWTQPFLPEAPGHLVVPGWAALGASLAGLFGLIAFGVVSICVPRLVPRQVPDPREGDRDRPDPRPAPEHERPVPEALTGRARAVPELERGEVTTDEENNG